MKSAYRLIIIFGAMVLLGNSSAVHSESLGKGLNFRLWEAVSWRGMVVGLKQEWI